MHPAQKRAVFVILDSIEQQLRQVKSLLYVEDAPKTGVPRETAPRQDPTYLSVDEEAEMERTMEAERLAAIEAESKIMADLFAEAKNG